MTTMMTTTSSNADHDDSDADDEAESSKASPNGILLSWNVGWVHRVGTGICTTRSGPRTVCVGCMGSGMAYGFSPPPCDEIVSTT